MKKKFYLTLDTETATLPCLVELAKTPKERQTIGVTRPIVYDIGWVISDRQGNIYTKRNFLVQETFFVPQVFNTAYYKEKRPIYIKMLEDKKIIAKKWNDIIEILLKDLKKVDFITAYNASFDFKKAIPFTERYIQNLYSENYEEWEKQQKEVCFNMLRRYPKKPSNPNYLEPVFILRGCEKPIIDLWSLACEKLINHDKYKNYCLKHGFLSNSGEFFTTSAEVTFRYLTKDCDFIESHTALDDAEIESHILKKILAKGKVEPILKAFPFMKLGKTIDHVLIHPKYKKVVIEKIEKYLDNLSKDTKYSKGLTKRLFKLLEEE